MAPLMTSEEVRAGKVVREGEVVVADPEGRPVHLTPGSNLVQRRTSAMSVFELVEKGLLHAIVLALRHSGIPEPHRTFILEGLDQILLAVEVCGKTVRDASDPIYERDERPWGYL